MPVSSERDDRAYARAARNVEEIGATLHDRKAAAVFHEAFGKGHQTAGRSAEARSSVDDRSDDRIPIGTEVHFDLVMWVSVDDCVGHGLSQRKRQAFQVALREAMNPCELTQGSARLPRRRWKRWYAELERFMARHRMKDQEILPQANQIKPAAAVYVLRCNDGSLYTGATVDLRKRVAAHHRGIASKCTRGRRPLVLIAWWHPVDFGLARSHEARFKRLSRAEKLRVLAGDEAFGCPLHKAPSLISQREEGRMRYTPPQPDELAAYKAEADASQIRMTTEKGDIVLRLFPDDAPMHSAAFLKLAKAGFYDGLNFHRVEPGFVVQGGDPDGDGTGGPGYRLKAEFNDRPHQRGTLAMARASDPDSAGSQFYICLADARFLDKQYTVFGEMTSGFEALDAIRRGDVMQKVTVEPRPA